MDEIPKDLKRWLKENNRYSEFIRLLKVCHYSIDDLTHKIKSVDSDGNIQEDYGIKRWFSDSIESKWVCIHDKPKISECRTMRYSDFLKSLGLKSE